MSNFRDKISELEKLSDNKLPKVALEIKDAVVRHKEVCGKNEMKQVVKDKILSGVIA